MKIHGQPRAVLCAALAALVVTGCAAPDTSSQLPPVRDAQANCPVHNVALLTLYLPTHDNCTFPDPAYEKARDQHFPFAPDLLFEPYSISEPLDVLICPQCWSAQQKWLRWGTPSPQQKAGETTSYSAPSAEYEASQP